MNKWDEHRLLKFEQKNHGRTYGAVKENSVWKIRYNLEN